MFGEAFQFALVALLTHFDLSLIESWVIVNAALQAAHSGLQLRLTLLRVLESTLAVLQALLKCLELGFGVRELSLEVKLDGGALVGSVQCVFDRDVDLGTVECSITGVELPFAGYEAVEGGGELLM